MDNTLSKYYTAYYDVLKNLGDIPEKETTILMILSFMRDFLTQGLFFTDKELCELQTLYDCIINNSCYVDDLSAFTLSNGARVFHNGTVITGNNNNLLEILADIRAKMASIPDKDYSATDVVLIQGAVQSNNRTWLASNNTYFVRGTEMIYINGIRYFEDDDDYELVLEPSQNNGTIVAAKGFNLKIGQFTNDEIYVFAKKI